MTMNDPDRPWHKGAIDAAKVIPSIAGAYFTGGTSVALIKALTAYASQFFVEVAAHGDKKEALKRSGLYYLLQLQNFHDDKSSCDAASMTRTVLYFEFNSTAVSRTKRLRNTRRYRGILIEPTRRPAR